MRYHESFAAFQKFIRDWLTVNPSAVQLDGGQDRKDSPATTDEVTLSDVPGLTRIVIEFHGDTTRDALNLIATGKIEDFILLGPQPGRKHWRFHHGKIPHDLADFGGAGGMYAYVKGF